MSKQNIIIINPLTQRPVKYGSRVYLKLVNGQFAWKEALLKRGDWKKVTSASVKY